MNEFRVEIFIDSGDKNIINFSDLSKDYLEKWGKDMESRALGEYYKRKIKIVDQRI